MSRKLITCSDYLSASGEFPLLPLFGNFSILSLQTIEQEACEYKGVCFTLLWWKKAWLSG